MSVMRNIINIESIKLWIKGLCDAVASINRRTEEAHKKYDDLFDKFTRYTVISNEIEGRQSQLVSISTTFGYETQSDPVVREFTFNHGGILRYTRTLTIKHTDPHEVVNFRTLINVVSQHIGDQEDEAVKRYLSKNGDTAIGSYMFNSMADGSGSVTFNVTTLFNKPSTFTKTLKCIDPVADNEAVNLGYLKRNAATLAASNMATLQPLFVSGKIAFDAGMTTGINSAYNIERVVIDDITHFQIKLMNYANPIGKELSWSAKFGSSPNLSIPGNQFATPGKMPYPVNFALMMEFIEDGVCRVSSIPNKPHNEGGIEWGVFSNGNDLILDINSNGYVKLPFMQKEVSLCDQDYAIRLYLVVSAWTYLPYGSQYLDIVPSSPDPQIIGINKIDISGKGPLHRIYKNAAYCSNFPIGNVTFECSEYFFSVVKKDDGSLDYIINVEEVGEFSENVSIRAFINGAVVASTSVVVILSNKQLEIQPVDINIRYSSCSDVFPLVLMPKQYAYQGTRNSQGDVTWTLDGASNCEAVISPTTGKLVIKSIASNAPSAVQISAQDSRYYNASGTFSLSPEDEGAYESLSIFGISDLSLLYGEYLLINGSRYQVADIDDESNTVELETPLPPGTYNNTPFSVDVITAKASANVLVKLIDID